jgi:hypothetical protein
MSHNLTEDVGTNWVLTKFAPRMMTDDQRIQPVSIYEGLLHQAMMTKKVLKSAITRHETRVYGYAAATK